MKRWLSISGLLLVACLSAHAQFPSIIQTLLNGVTTAQASGVVTNNGQTGHNAYLQFGNAAAHTCSNPAATAQLEYSFNNSTWTAFGTPNTATTISTLTQTYLGLGLFPYIRFNLTAFDTTNCTATVYYTGVQQAITVLAAPGVPAQQLFCQSYTTGSNSTSGAVSTVISAPSAGAIHVCAFFFYIQSTSTETWTFGTGSAGACGSLGSNPYVPVGLPAGGSTNAGTGAGQLFTVGASLPLCIQTFFTAGGSAQWAINYQVL